MATLTLGELPSWNSIQFASLCVVALVTPYIFICAIYYYHFSARSINKILRTADPPKADHIFNWQRALFRPEGISAVVGYMAIGLFISIILEPTFNFDVVPKCIKTLSLRWHPTITLLYLLIFDSLVYCIHYVQHQWRWLYYHTHAVHHKITSPTMIVALTGYLPDTCLLILVPLHTTIYLVDFIPFFGIGESTNFITVFMFAVVALLHLHCVHSEFEHFWDPFWRKIGIINSWDHHVHHIRPTRNLAHFFVFIDKLGGTYTDPMTIAKINIK